MTRGVIYYNRGTGAAVRLLVSLASLRQHYAGPVTILSDGEDSHVLCQRIADALGAEVRAWTPDIAPGRNTTFLAKTLYHTASPYEISVCVDSDTLVVGAIDEVFNLGEAAGFAVAQLGNWRSNGSTIGKRIRAWSAWLPEMIEPALQFGPAINCGVVSFHRDAALLRDWFSLALPGRDTFIPDEVCCQLILHRYPHTILDGRWNRSCKYDDPDLPDTRIIHYHGRKHCRPGLPFHGEGWCRVFEEIVARNVADVAGWMPAGDRMLTRYLRGRDRKRLARPVAVTVASSEVTPKATAKKAMRFAVYRYSGSRNLGDAIQTIALQRLLPGEVGYVDRREGIPPWPDAVWVVNGWLGRNTVPLPAVRCVFAGVFLQEQSNLAWLASSQAPVGARDPYTREALQSEGVSSELIGCATMTLDRYHGERFGTYAVDVPDAIDTPRAAVRLSHCIPHDLSWSDQLARATHFLELYKRANLVYTSRLHVVLPCLAFGTPVSVIDPLIGQTFDPRAIHRFSILAHLGIQFSEPTVDSEGRTEAEADKFRSFLTRHLSTQAD